MAGNIKEEKGVRSRAATAADEPLLTTAQSRLGKNSEMGWGSSQSESRKAKPCIVGVADGNGLIVTFDTLPY